MSFYYVQRLEAAPEGVSGNPFGSDIRVSKVLLDAGAGVDLAYMGSSEFESGMAAQSGNRIATVASGLKVVTQALTDRSYKEDVHFVCTDEQADTTLREWMEWAKAPKTIEPTDFFKDEHRDVVHENRDVVVGWWALQEDLIWARDYEVADRIRQAFVNIASPQE